MLRPWTKILPFFFIEWYSKRYCEVFHVKENDVWLNTIHLIPIQDSKERN